MTNEVRAVERRIPGALIAGIRFLGQFEELPERFTRLRAVAQEAVIGPAIVLLSRPGPGRGLPPRGRLSGG